MNNQRLPVAGANDTSVAPPLSTFGFAEDEYTRPGLSFAQILSIVRAYWKLSLLAFIALLCTAAVLIALEPKSYVATATLIVNHGDRNPLASADLPTALENTFLPTQIQLIRSPVVLEPVARQLHLTEDREFTHGFTGPRTALLENVVVNLDKSLTVYQGKKSELLYIAASSRTPAKSAAIANAVAHEYLKLNRLRIDQPATQRAKTYSHELEDLRAKTIAAQDRVTAFRERHGMITLAAGGADEAEATLANLEQKLLTAESQERSLAAEQAAKAWNVATPGTQVPNGLADALSREEAQLAKLRQTLGPQHPDVLALRSQIAATREAIASGVAAQLADARKLVGQYAAAVRAQRRRVLRKRSLQGQGKKLLLELQSAEATYKRALDGYPEIEFATHGHASDVSLVSLAEPPARAAKPDKVQRLLMGAGVSLGLAFALPFLYELLVNRRLRCRDDLERHFDIPVLAEFGPVTRRGSY